MYLWSVFAKNPKNDYLKCMQSKYVILPDDKQVKVAVVSRLARQKNYVNALHDTGLIL